MDTKKEDSMTQELKLKALDEVAKKHKLILDENDPVFAVVTIMETVMQESVDRFDVLLKMQAAAIEEHNVKLLAESKQLAQTIIAAKVTEVVNHMEKMKADALMEIEQTASKNRNLPQQREKSTNTSTQHNIYLFGVGIIALLIGMILGILLF